MTQAHANRGHSLVGASSAYRWMRCPGSVALIRSMGPQERSSSEFAAWGTCAHELAELMLTSWAGETKTGKRVPIGTIEQIDGYSIVVDKDMHACVDVYLETIWNDIAEDPIAKGCELNVEKPFQLAFDSEAFGTNDASYISESGVLRVYDLKSGAGVTVEVDDNPQLMYYAAGAYYGEGKRLIKEIEIVVIQPRRDHHDGSIRRDRFGAFDLEVWVQRELKPAIKRVREANAELNPEPGRCRWCPAAIVCPALGAAAMEHARKAFGGELPPAKVPKKEVEAAVGTLGSIGEAYLRLPLLKAYTAAVEDRVREQMLQDPTSIPELKLVENFGHRAWVDENSIGLWMEENLGARALSEPKLLSPAQTEGYIKGLDLDDGIAEQWLGELQSFIHKPMIGPKVVEASAKGTEYHKPGVKEAFGED